MSEEVERSASKAGIVDTTSGEGEKNTKEAQQNTYIIRPNFSQKFRPITVKETIHTVLGDMLTGKTYSTEDTPVLTKEISDGIKDRLKDMGYDRYKFIVQVVIGEQRGEGVKIHCSVWRQLMESLNTES